MGYSCDMVIDLIFFSLYIKIIYVFCVDNKFNLNNPQRSDGELMGKNNKSENGREEFNIK